MTDNTIKCCINDLLGVCAGGINGYRRASEVVEDDGLRTILMSYATQRMNYRNQLIERILLPLELEPEQVEEPQMLGAMHRGWIAFQSIFEGDVYVLYACEQAEYVALGVYKQVLNELQDANYRTIISSQEDGIRRSWAHMRELQALHR